MGLGNAHAVASFAKKPAARPRKNPCAGWTEGPRPRNRPTMVPSPSCPRSHGARVRPFASLPKRTTIAPTSRNLRILSLDQASRMAEKRKRPGLRMRPNRGQARPSPRGVPRHRRTKVEWGGVLKTENHSTAVPRPDQSWGNTACYKNHPMETRGTETRSGVTEPGISRRLPNLTATKASSKRPGFPHVSAAQRSNTYRPRSTSPLIQAQERSRPRKPQGARLKQKKH